MRTKLFTLLSVILLILGAFSVLPVSGRGEWVDVPGTHIRVRFFCSYQLEQSAPGRSITLMQFDSDSPFEPSLLYHQRVPGDSFQQWVPVATQPNRKWFNATLVRDVFAEFEDQSYVGVASNAPVFSAAILADGAFPQAEPWISRGFDLAENCSNISKARKELKRLGLWEGQTGA